MLSGNVIFFHVRLRSGGGWGNWAYVGHLTCVIEKHLFKEILTKRPRINVCGSTHSLCLPWANMQTKTITEAHEAQGKILGSGFLRLIFKRISSATLPPY